MKILIADDAEPVRKRLAAMIKKAGGGHTVAEATDAEEAVHMAEKMEPDFMIIDIRMPKGTGIDVLKTIKARKIETVVAILTNYPYPQYREKCIEAGADYFFDKSTEFSRVIDVLKGFAK
ncbi:MAG: response regulator [Syntrophus sp. (in: bacteria)]|nr:response regulator [Syntrophus sp. (in: bacteria)]